MPNNRKKTKEQGKQRVWGIRVPAALQSQFLNISATLNVSVSRLVVRILMDWLDNNAKTLDSAGEPLKLQGHILTSDLIFEKKNTRLSKNAKTQSSPELKNIKSHMTMRNVPVETRLMLKSLAYQRGITIPELLTQLIEREWANEGNKEPRAGLQSRLRKDINKLLRRAVKQS